MEIIYSIVKMLFREVMALWSQITFNLFTDVLSNFYYLYLYGQRYSFKFLFEASVLDINVNIFMRKRKVSLSLSVTGLYFLGRKFISLKRIYAVLLSTRTNLFLMTLY